MGGTDHAYEFYIITVVSLYTGISDTQVYMVGQMFEFLSSISQLSLNHKKKERSQNLQTVKVFFKAKT